MFKEFLQDMLIDLLHLGVREDRINRKLSDLDDRIRNLQRTAELADKTNHEAIKFLLSECDINKEIFREYKYFVFTEAPWYIQDLLIYKYKLAVQMDIDTLCSYIYYKGALVGGKNSSHIGEILDDIEIIDNKSRKKSK